MTCIQQVRPGRLSISLMHAATSQKASIREASWPSRPCGMDHVLLYSRCDTTLRVVNQSLAHRYLLGRIAKTCIVGSAPLGVPISRRCQSETFPSPLPRCFPMPSCMFRLLLHYRCCRLSTAPPYWPRGKRRGASIFATLSIRTSYFLLFTLLFILQQSSSSRTSISWTCFIILPRARHRSRRRLLFSLPFSKRPVIQEIIRNFLTMDLISKHNVVHKLEKRSLLIAINCIAALSIFFFGYDQGMMGGVNGAQNYYEEHMHFGHPKKDGTPEITNELLQGGIVS